MLQVAGGGSIIALVGVILKYWLDSRKFTAQTMGVVVDKAHVLLEAASQDRQNTRAELLIAWDAQKEAWKREREMTEREMEALKKRNDELNAQNRELMLQNVKYEKVIFDFHDRVSEAVTWIDEDSDVDS